MLYRSPHNLRALPSDVRVDPTFTGADPLILMVKTYCYREEGSRGPRARAGDPPVEADPER